jgi:hypothetical protein
MSGFEDGPRDEVDPHEEAIAEEVERDIDPKLRAAGHLPGETLYPEMVSSPLLEDMERSTRELLAVEDFSDAGSFDVEIMRRIGYDVFASKEILTVLMRNARIRAKQENRQPTTEDLVKERDQLDIESMHIEQTQRAYGYLAWLDIIDDEELNRIKNEGGDNERRDMYKLSRLLDSPAMASLLDRLNNIIRREGRKLTFQEVMNLSWSRVQALNREQAAIDAGDPLAIEQRERKLQRPDMRKAADERSHEEEFKRLPREIPPPEELN